MLHACCHNPTGADLSDAQWDDVVAVCRERGLIPFLDMAYQGFADGIDQDAVAVRQFVQSGLSFVISSSFSKSFSLYGERVGALSIVTASKDEAARVLSQLKRTIRTNYSNPPTHGGAIVAAVLNSPELRQMWETELAGMRDRIRSQHTLTAIGHHAPFSRGHVGRQRHDPVESTQGYTCLLPLHEQADNLCDRRQSSTADDGAGGIDSDTLPGVVDMKVARGSGNIAREAAMTRQQAEDLLCASALLTLRQAAEGVKVFGVGEFFHRQFSPARWGCWVNFAR
mgnify:CR=1 FL=1